MARKRAYKRRIDYRKGGRVQYNHGGRHDEDGEGGDIIDPNINTGIGVIGGTPGLPGGGATLDPNAKAKADARAKFDLISATGNYTPQQTTDVQNAIAIGAITTDEAAAKFGVQPAQITQEIARREQVADPTGTGTTDIADPFANVIGGPTKIFPDMEARRKAEAKKAADLAKQATDVADITADGRYTPAETQQVVDALNSGAITSQQAADQFGATVAQVEAELKRQNEVADTGATDILDPFAGGVQAATRPKLLDRATQAQINAINLSKVDDPKTAVDESKQKVPGAILKDYTRIDPNLLFDDRVSKDLNIESGITKDADIEAVDSFVDIIAPTGVDDNDFSAATGIVTKAVEAG